MSDTVWIWSHLFKARSSECVAPHLHRYSLEQLEAMPFHEQIENFMRRWTIHESEPVPYERMEFIRTHAIEFEAVVRDPPPNWMGTVKFYFVRARLPDRQAAEFMLRWDVWEP